MSKQQKSYPKQTLLNYKFDLSKDEFCDLLRSLVKAIYVEKRFWKEFSKPWPKILEMSVLYGNFDLIKLKEKNKEVRTNVVKSAFKGYYDKTGNIETVKMGL